ncbi:hypothetical protein [Chryseobacterium sp. GVT01B]|uniref:hypothetical protein n=1 Tax=Chryseobacterium sp. GVT01B TaxID=2862675 RepID=UPI001CBFE65D|nr:hypothetical protein [Chryseobacterium sp. GVT01B]
MSRLISIRFYRQMNNAKKDKLLLEKNGINGFIASENFANADSMLLQAVGGIQLQVFDVDIEDAINILKSDRTHDELAYAGDANIKTEVSNPSCNRCGSHHIFQIEKLGGIFGMSRRILGFPIEISKTDYYCYYCDGEFIC